jgi:hypothetical protein
MASHPRRTPPATRPWAIATAPASPPPRRPHEIVTTDRPTTPDCPARDAQVVKRIRPGQPGSRRLQHRYRPALVCVRYRESENGQTRFTTVELIVDQGPPRRQPMVRVNIRDDDAATRRQAMALGAEWDGIF